MPGLAGMMGGGNPAGGAPGGGGMPAGLPPNVQNMMGNMNPAMMNQLMQRFGGGMNLNAGGAGQQSTASSAPVAGQLFVI